MRGNKFYKEFKNEGEFRLSSTVYSKGGYVISSGEKISDQAHSDIRYYGVCETIPIDVMYKEATISWEESL